MGFLWGFIGTATFTGEKKRLQSKMESRKAIISEMEDTIRNTLLGAVGTTSGCSGGENGMAKLRGRELYNSEDDFGGLRKKRKSGKSQKCSRF